MRWDAAAFALRAAAVALVVAGLASWRVGTAGPNVVLIVIDTLRADHVGAYGYARPTSPSLDGLAASGTRFTRAYAPSSWTGASVASIMTGLYPEVHGLKLHNSVLSAELPRLAESFHDAGYETAAISANPAFVTPELGFDQGFRRFQMLHGPPTTEADGGDIIWADPTMTQLVKVATANRVTDAALAWLHGLRGAPFFLYLHYFDPHAGYFPPPEYASRFGADPRSVFAGPRQRIAMWSGRAPENPDDLATLIALYDGEVAFTDAEIGRLLATLSSLITTPTIVVVTADHGEEFGDHGGLQHGRTLFEEQLRVPLIVAAIGGASGSDSRAGVLAHGRDPLGLSAGSLIETPFSLVDLWALLAGITGVAPTPGKPALTLGDLATVRESSPIFADLATVGRLHRWAEITDPWKLIVNRDRTLSLYDLAADPHEQHDRATDEPGRARSLRADLASRNAACVAQRTGSGPRELRPLSDERRERLRALGYVR